MLFAHLKRILKLDRLRLRGPNGAQDEFLLAATAQNLRKLAKLITGTATKTRLRVDRAANLPFRKAGRPTRVGLGTDFFNTIHRKAAAPAARPMH